MPDAIAPLPSLDRQVDRLVSLGVHTLAGMAEPTIRESISSQNDREDSLLIIQSEALTPSVLTPLIDRSGKAGFVVTDMVDVDQFRPIPESQPPDVQIYVARGLDRGDEMANWSPKEALPEIVARRRSPLTLAEGIFWVLQSPEVLARNHCFMTIGSRLHKADGGLDARTPALWISNGTGRDGPAKREAPKVGWCWAGNRHTWLGFASAASRSPLGPQPTTGMIQT